MELRFRITLVALFGLAAVAVWTFPAWRAFLREQQGNETFPGLELDLQEDFLALPADQRAALIAMRATSPEMALGMVQVAIGEADIAPEAERELNAETARVLASGTFGTIDALHWGKGTATIYEFDDRRILRFEGFSSARGGDVRVYLARDPQPMSALELGTDYLNLGRLKGNIGNQNYILPENHDISIYQSAVVYCKQFEVVITSARLR